MSKIDAGLLPYMDIWTEMHTTEEQNVVENEVVVVVLDVNLSNPVLYEMVFLSATMTLINLEDVLTGMVMVVGLIFPLDVVFAIT
jgi:hypothetical protein